MTLHLGNPAHAWFSSTPLNGAAVQCYVPGQMNFLTYLYIQHGFLFLVPSG